MASRSQNLAAIREYIRELRPLLQLCHWRFIVPDQYPDTDDAHGSFERPGSTRCGVIRLSDRIFEIGPDTVRHTVVHELLHATTADLMTAHEDIVMWFDPSRAMMARERLLHEIEAVVDGLANLLCPTLPLPVLPGWVPSEVRV